MSRKLQEAVDQLRDEIPSKRRVDLLSFRLALSLFIVGAIVSLVVAPLTKVDLFLGFISVPISYLVYEQYQQHKYFTSLQLQITHLRLDCDQLFNTARAVGTYTAKLDKLNKLDPALHAVGLLALDEALTGVWASVGKKSITISGQKASGKGYQWFWEYITRQLVSERRRIRQRPIARITHAADVGDWYKDQSDRINREHKSFNEFGNVFRIFIDTKQI